MNKILNKLDKAKYFLRLDLKSVYYQIGVKLEYISKTIFRTHESLRAQGDAILPNECPNNFSGCDEQTVLTLRKFVLEYSIIFSSITKPERASQTYQEQV